MKAMCNQYSDDVTFICGYEAGCRRFTLYIQLTGYRVRSVILAPAPILVQQSEKKVKTDKLDDLKITECQRIMTTVQHVPTA